MPLQHTDFRSTEQHGSSSGRADSPRGFVVNVDDRAIVALTGADGQDLLQRLSTNDVSRLKRGESIQSVLTNEKGRIVDVVSVVKLDEGELLLVGQSSRRDDVVRWLEKYIIMEDAKAEPVDSRYGHLMVYGIDTGERLDALFVLPEETIKFLENWNGAAVHHLLPELANLAKMIGELQTAGILNASLDHYEEFRVLHAIPRYPNELSELYNPLETNLGTFISWTKGCYIGQEVIARLDTYKKVQKRLVRLLLDEVPDSLPQPLHSEQGEAGTITSAIKPRTGQSAQGLGYVRTTQLESRGDLFFNKGNLRISVRPVTDGNG